MCQLFETVARKIAEVDFDSTSRTTLDETIARGDTSIATIVCNISSYVAPCVRAIALKNILY